MTNNYKSKILLDELISMRTRIVQEIQELQEELNKRKQIEIQINKLKNQLEFIQSMVNRFVTKEETESLFRTMEKPKRPIKAIMELMRENPDKKYTPTQLRDELEYLKKQNLLLSDAKNLLFVVHSCLRGLLRASFIMKVYEEDDSVFYQYNDRRKG